MSDALRTWPSQPAGRIALLDVDPDLASSDGAASGRLTVPVYRITAGPMPEPPVRAGGTPALGYLLLKGLLLYEVSVCGRTTAELLGPGDVVRPWPRSDAAMLASRDNWTVLEQVLLGDLAPVDATRFGSTHEIVEALLARCAERAERVAIQRSIAAHVRVDVRVLAYLWHLADRFGVVLPGAVRLNIPLTHAVLARLVGARRPTVTTALQRLIHLGYLRRENRAFVLVGDAGTIAELESRSPARDFALPEPNGYVGVLHG
jgi:CRP/FNR family transcriptional regulator, cyclic AMP receptor protein